MKKPIQLSVPEPCHEDWSKMTPEDKGRFCASCQKKVFDFTKSSDREIIALLEKEENACGRFLNTQLNRDLILPAGKSKLWPAAAVMSFFSLGTIPVMAQTPVATEQNINEHELMVGKVAMPPKKITGTVSDASGPMPGAIITIEGSKTTTQTDFDGDYAIDTYPGFTLVYSFPGYTSQVQKVSESTVNINIILEEEIQSEMVIMGYRTTNRAISGGVSIITKTEIKKRTFFGRIFHSIGNLFR
jgi:hypothetical protein